ncbi:ribonuclease N [Lentzea tibetensis]|uniref:Ribonuclease N n=1 Tax=Lentzea tibetensis TaxID=2591470 RepID=A0A563EGB0_9PSEU|nr:ribonuclease domain-containing protein [Lentzea tibetensis]TWP45273.1 ribonuclease N [Lentzea tibetensis]
MSPGRRLTVALVGLIALVVVGWFARDVASTVPPADTAPTIVSSGAPNAPSGMQTKALSSLPPEAGKTYQLIKSNGPFPYPRNDGVTFQNREKRLPAKKSDYYREYTVPTPGSQDRGARRLITGQQEELYYTQDHYDSFVVVDVRK